MTKLLIAQLLILSLFLYSCNSANDGNDPHTLKSAKDSIESSIDSIVSVPDSQAKEKIIELPVKDPNSELNCKFLEGRWSVTITSEKDGKINKEGITFECYGVNKLRLKPNWGISSMLVFQGEAVGYLWRLSSKNIRNETADIELTRDNTKLFGSLKKTFGKNVYYYSLVFEK